MFIIEFIYRERRKLSIECDWMKEFVYVFSSIDSASLLFSLLFRLCFFFFFTISVRLGIPPQKLNSVIFFQSRKVQFTWRLCIEYSKNEIPWRLSKYVKYLLHTIRTKPLVILSCACSMRQYMAKRMWKYSIRQWKQWWSTLAIWYLVTSSLQQLSELTYVEEARYKRTFY